MVDFLLIGPFNIVTYKNVFPLIKYEVISLGYNNVEMFCDGSKFGNIVWFTTLSKEDPGFIELSKRYDDSYVEFDNYNAINVYSVEDIPIDYQGVIGVPVSFIEKLDKRQFEIVDLAGGFNKGIYLEGVKKYPRLLIKKR